MSLLFDTSAIIGTLERRNPNGRRLIDGSDALPSCHFASLGELEAGVRNAVRASGDARRLAGRRATLAFAGRMPRCALPTDQDIACFGVIVANTSRKLSHNDQWILAAAFVHTHDLVTEDEGLHDAANDTSLRDAVMSDLGHGPLRSILI